jgi:hypothetical protein
VCTGRGAGSAPHATGPYGSALHAAARARDPKGWLLPERVAATTVLNVVRPTVAVAWFVAFAGKALDEYPEWRERIANGDDAALDAFVQEVRRLYPFVPVLAARARAAQDVLGVRVPGGGLVVLDVHGTNHDPEHRPEPDRFDPDRFLQGRVDPDTLVPQGGGDVTNGHRCPGEGVTLTMLAVAVRALAGLPQTLAPPDLDYDLSRIPTRPRSGVVITPTPASVSAEQAGGLRTRQRHRAAGSSSLSGVTEWRRSERDETTEQTEVLNARAPANRSWPGWGSARSWSGRSTSPACTSCAATARRSGPFEPPT